MTDSEFCLSHDPNHAARLAETRSRGGQLQRARAALAKARREALAKVGSGTPVPDLASIEAMTNFLVSVVDRVDSQALSPAQGTVLVNALRLAKDLLALAVEVKLVEEAREAHHRAPTGGDSP
jgi:hypothetical protein